MSGVLLEIKGLEKTFPGVRALKGVQLTVNKGEVHGLMGENGAGKSTLIKVLTGIYQKNGGSIRFDGEEINAATVHIEALICDAEQRVIFIADSHPPKTREFNSYPSHCVIGTKDSEVIQELQPYVLHDLTEPLQCLLYATIYLFVSHRTHHL